MACYICHERMSCPLQVCSEKHYACAGCLRTQIHYTVGLKYTKGYVDHIPVLKPVKTDVSSVKCGPCRKPMQPAFPGSLMMKLVDPKCRTTCEFCSKSFSLTKIGLHILECRSGRAVSECPWCKNKYEDISNHLLETCRAIECEICLAKGQRFTCTYLQMLAHVKAHQMGERMKTQTQLMLNQLVAGDINYGISGFMELCTVFLTLAEVRSCNRVNGSDVNLMSKLRSELKAVGDEYQVHHQDKRNDLVRRLNAVYDGTAKILASVETEFANKQAKDAKQAAVLNEAFATAAAVAEQNQAEDAERKVNEEKRYEPDYYPQDPEWLPSEPDLSRSRNVAPTYSPPPHAVRPRPFPVMTVRPDRRRDISAFFNEGI